MKNVYNYLKQIKKNKEMMIAAQKDDSYTRNRPYKYIPLYSRKEMKQAKVDDTKENLYEYVGRQALNGYVGLYKNNWVVGKNGKGEIVKTKQNLLFENEWYDIEKRNYRIMRTQNHALYGKDLQEEVFCKFTYDIKDQTKYSTHVELVKEYKEAEIAEDSGKYGGLHFVPINNIKYCLDYSNTVYGDKIAIIEPLCDEVYYEYMENFFVGEKVYVKKVMRLCDIETSRMLNDITDILKEYKSDICNYLHKLESINSSLCCKESVEYIENL